MSTAMAASMLDNVPCSCDSSNAPLTTVALKTMPYMHAADTSVEDFLTKLDQESDEDELLQQKSRPAPIPVPKGRCFSACNVQSR